MLDALRDELRERKYVPILFDFDKPTSQTRDETITLLARMSRDAGGVPGPGVVRTIGALVRRQRSPGELQHFCWAIRHQQQPCIMALVPPRVRMFGAECLVAHGDGAKEERLGLVRPTKVPEQEGEVAEARRRARMLGAQHLLPDRQRALIERPRLNIGGKRVMPVKTGETEQVSRPLFNPFRSGRVVSYESEGVRIEPPGQAPSLRIAPDVLRIDGHQRLHQYALRTLSHLTLASCCRDLTYQPVQTDAVGDDRGVALVGNCLPVDQRERPQRRHRFVKAVAFELGSERLAEFLAALREQRQRDRLRREQRGVHDQRLRGGVELRGFVETCALPRHC